jgi:aminoglycoside phosphotransferase (APT) family kinase protein
VHDNEVVATEALVRDLLREQLPDWAELELTPVAATGTDNIIFRLGREMSVRLPRIEAASNQIQRDQEWLPALSRSLPCAISTPLAIGEPGPGYPFPWAVHAWLEGTNPTPGDLPELALDLAAFVRALSTITVGPPSSRSGPLTTRHDAVVSALTHLGDEIDVAAARKMWDAAVAAPEHLGPPVWRHADLTVGNLLVKEGRLAAVIDWGPSGLGDPAADLVPAWRVFRGGSREVFRAAMGADADTWTRASGWALSIALLELAYYRERDRWLAEAARVALRELLPC